MCATLTWGLMKVEITYEIEHFFGVYIASSKHEEG